MNHLMIAGGENTCLMQLLCGTLLAICSGTQL